MRRSWLTVAALLSVAGMLNACMQTNYRSLDASADSGVLFSRDIYYHIADAFYDDPPECAVVLPPADTGVPLGLTTLIEQSLALRLGQKINRVIGPLERSKIERELALDTRDLNDRPYLARTEHCRAYLAWRLVEMNDNHFFVWSRKQIGLEVRLVSADEDTILWQASHTAHRSDGGLPLSLLSLPIAAAKATLFSQDADQLPSMIDDVVRRLAVTLPDVR